MSGRGGDLAGYGPRVGATLLDGLIVGGVAVVLAVLAAAAGVPAADTSVVVVAVAVAGSLFYAPVLMCRSGAHNGQTLGKQALGVRVVRHDALPMTAQPALLREFVGKGLLGLIPFYTVIDYLFPLADQRRQAIHDKIASTFVVRADAVPDLDAAGAGDAAPEVAGLPPGWAPPAAPSPEPPPARGDAWAPPAAPPPAPPRREDDDVRGPFGPSG